MEVAEGEGTLDEINPVTAGMEVSDWGARMDMEESGSLPPCQRINESGNDSERFLCKRGRTETAEILGIISSSDEGESPDSPVMIARRGRAGENKGGGVEDIN